MHWILTVPDRFSLPHIIRHSLACEQFKLLQPPFSVHRGMEHLHRVERLQSGNTVDLTLSQTPAGLILRTKERLTGTETEEISQKTRRMLRLEEHVQPFSGIAHRTPGPEKGALHGEHLLRGATFFEDVIKAIILTHETKAEQGQRITWIVDRFGDPLPSNPTRHAFPTPQQLFWGHRIVSDMFPPPIAGRLIQAAEKFCATAEEIEALSCETFPTDVLAAELVQLFDFEPETLGLVMLSLGRYDYIPATPCIQPIPTD